MTGNLETMNPSDDGHEPPVMMTEDASARRTRRPWRTALTAGGLAAVVGVVTLGVGALMDRGGSDSPEGAVKQLADAISHEDLLAAVEVLNPDEVAGLATLVDQTAKRARELELVNDAAAPLAGIDLTVGNLDLSTETLADGYVKVYVRGEGLSFRATRDELSPMLQRAWKDSRNEIGDDAPITDLAPEGLDPFVVTVQRDGGWYVSPAYTVLEYIRANENGPAADYGSGLAQAPGADSPEQAARDALEAYSAGNWDRLWELAAPGEVPLYDYRATLAQALAETDPPNFTIDDFTPTVKVDGDRAFVTVQASGRLAHDRGAWSLDDECFVHGTADSDYDQFSLCPGSIRGGFPFGYGFVGNEAASSAPSALRFVTVQRNGRWFLSPVATFTKVLTQMVQGVDKRELATLFGLQRELTPDGSLTLDQPVTSPTPTEMGVSYVYTFEGRKGQEVVLEFERLLRASDAYSYPGDAFILDADGRDLGESRGIATGYPFELPRDGDYRLVVTSYTAAPFTFTLWDKEHAPEGVVYEFDEEGLGNVGPVCSTNDVTGETECEVASTATTAPDGGFTGYRCTDPTACESFPSAPTSVAFGDD